MQTQKLKKFTCLAGVVLLLLSCSKNRVNCTGDTEQNFVATGFEKITIADNFHVTITRSTAFSVKAKGCTENINDLMVSVSANGLLTVKYKNTGLVHNKVLDITITLPKLIILNASAATKVSTSGFYAQSSYLRTELSGAAEVIVNGTPTEVTYSLSGASKLKLTGTTDGLFGELDGAAFLDAYGLTSQYTDIKTAGTAKAYVTAWARLSAEASGASEVHYKGNPPRLYKEVSGSAKVIKE